MSQHTKDISAARNGGFNGLATRNKAKTHTSNRFQTSGQRRREWKRELNKD